MFKYTTDNAFTHGIVSVTGVVEDGISEILTGFNPAGEAVRVYPAYMFDTLEEALDNCQKQAEEAISKYQERIAFIKSIDFSGDFERKQRKAQSY